VDIEPEKQTLSLVIAHGDITSPPLSHAAREWIGFKLRSVQEGESIAFPASRPMPSIGPRCHELRLTDDKAEWRVVYHIAAKSVVVLDVFRKMTQKTPKHVIDQCKTRLAAYNQALKDAADARKRKERGNDRRGRT